MRSIQPQLWQIPRWAQELHKLTIRSLQASATMLQLPVSDVAVCRPMSSKSSSSSSSSSSMSSSSVLQSSPQISLSALKSAQTTNSPLVGDVDRHNGITVDLGQLPVNFADSDFSRILEGINVLFGCMYVGVCVCVRARMRTQHVCDCVSACMHICIL